MNRSLLILGIILVILGVSGLVFLSYVSFGNWGIMQPQGMMGSSMQRMMSVMMRDYSKNSYKSNGEKIYLTGENEKGERISNSMMPPQTPMAQMMRMGCANCHGKEGKGGLLFPDGKTKSANIAREHLKEHKPPYTEKTLKKAITQGTGPDGDELSTFMPRWEISEGDLNDLVDYLKTL